MGATHFSTRISVQDAARVTFITSHHRHLLQMSCPQHSFVSVPRDACACIRKPGHKKTERGIQTLTVSRPTPSLLFVPVDLLLFARDYPPRSPYRPHPSVLSPGLIHRFVHVPPVGSGISATPLVTFLLH